MIPVQNIYYMLSYAFQALQTQTYKNLATENFHNTAELCAAILDKGVSTQLKRVLVENSSYVQIICFFNKACVLMDWEILSFPCSVERDSDFGT